MPKLEAMNRKLENVEEERNPSDTELLDEPDLDRTPKKRKVLSKKAVSRTSSKVDIDLTEEVPTVGRKTRSSKGKKVVVEASKKAAPKGKEVEKVEVVEKKKEEEVVDDFVPMGQEFLDLIRLLPPPTSANTGASLNIRREMKAMIKQQKEEGPLKCGFYFDPFVSLYLSS